MSYICIIANEKGAVAAGDSRLTLYPAQLNLHLDRTRKVFQDEKQGLVWACCGLTYFGGIHYFKAVERILRSESMTMGAKLNKITTLMERATKVHHLISFSESSFTLLLSSVKTGETMILKVVNGVAEKETITGPVAIEDGSGAAGALPAVAEVAEAAMEELVKMARGRAMTAAKNAAEGYKNEGKPQTVGGNTRVVYLEAE